MHFNNILFDKRATCIVDTLAISFSNSLVQYWWCTTLANNALPRLTERELCCADKIETTSVTYYVTLIPHASVKLNRSVCKQARRTYESGRDDELPPSLSVSQKTRPIHSAGWPQPRHRLSEKRTDLKQDSTVIMSEMCRLEFEAYTSTECRLENIDEGLQNCWCYHILACILHIPKSVVMRGMWECGQHPENISWPLNQLHVMLLGYLDESKVHL